MSHLRNLTDAVDYSNLAAAEEFLRAGANPNQPDFMRQRPLEIALQMKNWPMAELLVQYGADVNRNATFGSSYNSLLHDFIYSRNIGAVEFLLDHGARVNIQNDAGETPLHYAARVNDPNLVTLLLQHGASRNRIIPNNQGQLPVDLARDPNIIQMLTPPPPPVAPVQQLPVGTWFTLPDLPM